MGWKRFAYENLGEPQKAIECYEKNLKEASPKELVQIERVREDLPRLKME